MVISPTGVADHNCRVVSLASLGRNDLEAISVQSDGLFKGQGICQNQVSQQLDFAACCDCISQGLVLNAVGLSNIVGSRQSVGAVSCLRHLEAFLSCSHRAIQSNACCDRSSDVLRSCAGGVALIECIFASQSAGIDLYINGLDSAMLGQNHSCATLNGAAAQVNLCTLEFAGCDDLAAIDN